MSHDPKFIRRLNYILWMTDKGGGEPPEEWKEAFTAGYEQRSYEAAKHDQSVSAAVVDLEQARIDAAAEYWKEKSKLGGFSLPGGFFWCELLAAIDAAVPITTAAVVEPVAYRCKTPSMERWSDWRVIEGPAKMDSTRRMIAEGWSVEYASPNATPLPAPERSESAEAVRPEDMPEVMSPNEYPAYFRNIDDN